MARDAFQENIDGVAALIGDPTNKISDEGEVTEGVEGDYEDSLDLKMTDAELLRLRDEWLQKSGPYSAKMKPRQDRNRTYVRGTQRDMTVQNDRVVSSNILFEATATFVPQALAENPEPVVFSDNTAEGKQASNDLKTMLQYHANVLGLRQKLGVAVWHWSIYFGAVLKHGWDKKTNDITLDLRRVKNLILDPDGYVDEFGDYKGAYLGEPIETNAQELIDMYPEQAVYITLKVNAKLGTKVVRTEWWTDDYCFTTFYDQVLDKHKNEFFNYPDQKEEAETGDEAAESETATPAINHFAVPKMPYTFLSVFSLQEQPLDFTNLVEQNIANQDRINDRDDQIAKNLASANNSVAISGEAFNEETAGQAVQTFYDEGFLLIPNGDMDAVKRIPASGIPDAVFTAQDNDKETLRSVYGTLGLAAQQQTKETTARGQILSNNQDASRIGGGVGDALETVAKNVFNWWTQLYAVFYDEPHYGAVLGTGQAVEYVTLESSFMQRKFVVTVSPNSMKPKDEVTEMNMAVELANAGWLDPINLFKKLNDPNPLETAKMVTMFRVNPQAYLATFFPEEVQSGQAATPPAGNIPPEPGSPPTTLAEPTQPSNLLSQVPLSTPAMPK